MTKVTEEYTVWHWPQEKVEIKEPKGDTDMVKEPKMNVEEELAGLKGRVQYLEHIQFFAAALSELADIEANKEYIEGMAIKTFIDLCMSSNEPFEIIIECGEDE